MNPAYPYTIWERRHLTLHGYPCALQMGPYSINGYITLPHQPGPTLGSGPLINKHDALKALKNPKTAPRPYIRKTKENNQ